MMAMPSINVTERANFEKLTGRNQEKDCNVPRKRVNYCMISELEKTIQRDNLK